MNPVAQRILETGAVSDGDVVYPLGQYHMDAREGSLLQKAIAAVRPIVSLEIGMAYGLSTLFICEELAKQHGKATHVVIDPFQNSDWRGIGMRHVREAGYEHLVTFYEERSEFTLPRLVAAGTKLDFALIDGWHTFDQALVEFYYINRMLRVGGIVAFDDADWPSLNRLLRYLVEYPSYEVFDSQPRWQSSWRGRLRRQLVSVPAVARIVHPTVRRRSWDLGIFDTCICLRKISEDERPITWFPDF